MERQGSHIALALLLIGCFNWPAGVNAQFWNKAHDFENGSDVAGSVQPLGNGQFFSFSRIFKPGLNGYWAFLLDENGDTLWTRAILDSTRFYSPGSSGSIIETTDGHFLVGAVVADDSLGWQSLAIKYTQLGDTVWTRSFGTTGFDNLNQVSEPYPNNYLLAGTRSDPTYDFGLYLINENGDLIWDRAYPNVMPINLMSGFKVIDGGIIMSGSRDLNANNSSLFVMKTDSSGSVMWDIDLGSLWEDNVAFIQEKGNGNLIVAGAVRTSETSAMQGYLAELEPDGDLIWEETYIADRIVFFTRPIPLDSGIAVAGTWWEGGITKGLLQKTDTVGTLLWQRVFETNLNHHHYLYDVRKTLDGGFILAGSAYDSLEISQDAWIVKVDSFGCLVPGCEIFDGIETQYTDLGKFLELAPNPATESTQLSFNLPDGYAPNGPITLSLVSIDGRLVQEEVLPKQQVYLHTLQLNEISKGVYFVHLRDSNHWLAGKKLIVH